MAEEKNKGLGQAMKKLEEIVNWFDRQEEVDVEKGLEKVKEGAALAKYCKAELAKIENEFKEVKADLKGVGEDEGETDAEKDGDNDPEKMPF